MRWAQSSSVVGLYVAERRKALASERSSAVRCRMLRFWIILFLSVLTLIPPAQAQPAPCPCDCDRNGRVRVSELIAAVSIALGNADPSACPEQVDDVCDRGYLFERAAYNRAQAAIL